MAPARRRRKDRITPDASVADEMEVAVHIDNIGQALRGGFSTPGFLGAIQTVRFQGQRGASYPEGERDDDFDD